MKRIFRNNNKINSVSFKAIRKVIRKIISKGIVKTPEQNICFQIAKESVFKKYAELFKPL